MEASGRGEQIARGVTFAISAAGKLLGMVIGANELVVRPSMRETAVGFAALLFAGAEAFERAMLRAMRSIFAAPPAEEKR